jgi:hypothetical protein
LLLFFQNLKGLYLKKNLEQVKVLLDALSYIKKYSVEIIDICLKAIDGRVKLALLLESFTSKGIGIVIKK